MRAWILLALACSVPPALAQEYPELGVRVETVAENLEIPWSIDWLPGGDIIFTERGGELRIIRDGQLAPEPLLSLGVAGVEGGMLGVAVDPGHEDNGFVYLYHTYGEFFSTWNKLSRYHLDGDTLTEDMVLLDRIPGGPFHDGGRIAFGPDGRLYVTTGDAGVMDLSQDPSSLAGKILRINPDGTIPADNPWEGSPVYSIGHRNPQGIDWDGQGRLVSTDHGPSGERGNAHDEVNIVVPGSNHGWPLVIGSESGEGLTPPALHTGYETWAPSGAEFYDGGAIPALEDRYLVATLLGRHLNVVQLDPGGQAASDKLFEGEFGRLRDVQTGPDGFVYLLTSNRDGRGSPGPSDDRILRLVPLGGCAGSMTVGAVPEGEGDSTRIVVTGCAPGADIVDITIADPDGLHVASGSAAAAADGSFEHTIEGGFPANGTWHVTAEAGGTTVSNTFVVPEFGQMAAVVMALGAAAAMAAARLRPGAPAWSM